MKKFIADSISRVGEVKIGYVTGTPPTKEDLPEIHSSREIRDFILEHTDDFLTSLREFFGVVYLSRKNKILGWDLALFSGGIAGTVADVRIILAGALGLGASSIILTHNHPSGNTQPSIADKDITNKIQNAAKVMDIRILDHVIIGIGYDYFSFADENLN